MKISLKTNTWEMEDSYLLKEKYVNATFATMMALYLNACAWFFAKNVTLLAVNVCFALFYLLPTLSFNKWRKQNGYKK